MNLKQKYFLWSSVLMALVLAFGAVSVWHLLSIWQSTRVAAAEYEAMDLADGVSGRVVWLRDALRTLAAPTYRDVSFFAPIETEILKITSALESASRTDDGDAVTEADLARKLSTNMSSAMRHVAVDATGSAEMTSHQAAGALDQLKESLDGVSKLIPSAARHHVTAASDRVLNRLFWTCFWLVVVLALSALIHYRNYRMLVRPLVWLRDDMEHSAGQDYKELVRLRGDEEFKSAALYFNGLARELAELYRSMEEKIVTRSRELVRSERLASVGFLAAGVAHEINNPLSVISGYAELATRSLRKLVDSTGDVEDAEAEAEALSGALEAQQIVRDEAFRCKEITSRLLSLARGGTDAREPLQLEEVARQVTVLTRGLKKYSDRQVVLDFESDARLEVVANATEMKQVFMNLTINALEAAAGERGEVRIGGKIIGEWVELYVQDNGRGMSKETLDRVFEPFFTAKRGVGDPGTGLGLSITNAIVENHGGAIQAESAGVGKGSRFTVRFPARRSGARQSGPILLKS